MAHPQFQDQQHPLITAFLSASTTQEVLTSQNASHPNYWTSSPASLLTTSTLHAINFGTGNRILESLLPALESAQSEILFVTCYWAPSDSLNRIADSLRTLSARTISEGRSRVRVRICLSSTSLYQKLTHTRSPAGKLYPPSDWSRVLGLPGPEELAGLDLTVKSVFFLPIGIVHPKFVVVDRERVWVPSCNVSWEEWFEGCVELGGGVVGRFVRFWGAVWADEGNREAGDRMLGHADGSASSPSPPSPALLSHLPLQQSQQSQIPTLLLPSPHHTSPAFRPFPWQSPPPPPRTPLNLFLLLAFEYAKERIYIQTPNLTSQPVIAALIAALERGVDVTVLTSERLQLWEQILTAGTTSGRCVAGLVAKHKALVRERSAQDEDSKHAAEHDIESAPSLPSPPTPIGRLKVSYYRSLPGREGLQDEPVQSHFKLTVVDGEVAVLGSGNMDRASWFTSQEVGVAVLGRGVVKELEGALGDAMEGRRRRFYEG